MDAGASRIFSSRRDAVTTAGFSCVANGAMRTSTCAVPPAVTRTPATRRNAYPILVTVTSYVPGARFAMRYDPSSPVGTETALAPPDAALTLALESGSDDVLSVTRPAMAPVCARMVTGRTSRASKHRDRLIERGVILRPRFDWSGDQVSMRPGRRMLWLAPGADWATTRVGVP